MLRATVAGLAAIIVLEIGCVESAVERIVTYGWQTSFDLDGDNENLREMIAGALRADPEEVSTESGELIAWAVKSDNDVPPFLVEEGIILLSPKATGSSKYRLVMVFRISGESVWLLGLAVPDVLETERKIPSSPDEDDIVDFIKTTSFGLNEHSPDIKVLRIFLFRKSSFLLRSLQAGIPLKEKWRRDEALCQP